MSLLAVGATVWAKIWATVGAAVGATVGRGVGDVVGLGVVTMTSRAASAIAVCVATTSTVKPARETRAVAQQSCHRMSFLTS